MATTGTKLTIPFTVGAALIVGQGTLPELWLLYSTGNVEAAPAWTTVADTRIRSFSVNRGRENELGGVDAGTATVVVENQDRAFDPAHTPAIRPLNRWWLRSQFSGVTEDMFLGYAESYQQEWPAPGFSDAVTTVSCVDEFKVLALDRLPVTDPPRDSYQDVVLFDQPSGYWTFNVNALTSTKPALVGEQLVSVPAFDVGLSTNTAIVGEEDGSTYKATQTDGANYWTTAPLDAGQSGDAGGLSAFTVEGWWRRANGLPSATEILVTGPLSAATFTWKLSMDTAGKFQVDAKNSAGTNHSLTSSTVADDDVSWYHVVGTITGGSLRLYVNGTEEGSTAFAGSFGAMTAGGTMSVGNGGATIGTRVRKIDELAFYRVGLSAARVLAHYQAGTARGFARSQKPGTRVAAVVDASTSNAATSIRTGTRNMTGSYMTGQTPLEELRKAENADAVDAVLFVAKDGKITFLDDGHRAVSPWNTVQATFDDDGTDLPYLDVTLDYSEAFLANEWNVTRTGGTTTSVSDSTSISRYFKRSQSLTDLPITDSADQSAIATAMLAKYKDPMTRVTGLKLDTQVAAVTEAAVKLEIGDRIRVFRTPPGGGARIDQTLFVQKIGVEGSNESPGVWRVTLGVSPL